MKIYGASDSSSFYNTHTTNFLSCNGIFWCTWGFSDPSDACCVSLCNFSDEIELYLPYKDGDFQLLHCLIFLMRCLQKLILEAVSAGSWCYAPIFSCDRITRFSWLRIDTLEIPVSWDNHQSDFLGNIMSFIWVFWRVSLGLSLSPVWVFSWVPGVSTAVVDVCSCQQWT